ncbi:DUF305 domain-containing protein [Xanthobacter autotrophicus]|uniref:DUF305 domain-containing protein n=1 Tax=Xanthobacter autotrophicus TaxID=280 RepID=UPI003727A51A
MRIRAPSLAIGLIALTAACTAGTAATQAQDVASVGAVAARPVDEAPFLAENAAAMDKMMTDMDVKPTGDVDVDFAAMMTPHHQGAVDMAVAYLRYGRNEQLRRLAQEIVVEQQQEIAAMRLALGQPLPPSASAPTQPGAAATAGSAGAAGPVHDHSAHGGMSHSGMSPAIPTSTK